MRDQYVDSTSDCWWYYIRALSARRWKMIKTLWLLCIIIISFAYIILFCCIHQPTNILSRYSERFPLHFLLDTRDRVRINHKICTTVNTRPRARLVEFLISWSMLSCYTINVYNFYLGWLANFMLWKQYKWRRKRIYNFHQFCNTKF